MPQPKRPPGRNFKPTQNEKTTLSGSIRWFLRALHSIFSQVFVGTLISIIVAVVQPYISDYQWGSSPEVIKVKYYKI